MATQTMDSNRNHHQKDVKRRRQVRRRETERKADHYQSGRSNTRTSTSTRSSAGDVDLDVAVPVQQFEATTTITTTAPTIRLLPLPTLGSTNKASYPPPPFPLPDNRASTPPGIIDADLHFLPVQQLASLGSLGSSGSDSYTDYYSNIDSNNIDNAGSAADAGMLWRYSATLMVSLSAWLVFLMLPKGLRKAYCRSGRRRYTNVYNREKSGAATTVGGARSGNNNMGIPRHANNFSNERNQYEQQQVQQRGRVEGEAVGYHHTMMSPPSKESVYSLSSSSAAAAAVPSPEHPALTRTPDQRILQGTMDRLVGGSGIRLMAHGVQCEPKRVWIRLHMADDEDDDSDDDYDDDDVNAVPHHEKQKQQHSLSWQTEFPRQITDASGRSSIVLFRGTTHKIDLATVLYVDVGKKTSALLKTNTANGTGNIQTEASTVPATTCFSLLTGNGSLDLQTNSRLERDALVACLSMVLDQVHQTHEWRRLYEESTIVGASMAASSTAYQVSSTAAARSLNLSNLGSPATNSNNKSNGSKFNDDF
jgi:hypothetical protein